MKKWTLGAVVGAAWGLISLIILSGGTWLNPLIRYTFGLSTTLAFRIVNWLIPITIAVGIWVSYILLFLLAPTIGALICVGIVYLIDKA